MAEVMKNIIFMKVVQAIASAQFFALTCDEATTNDNYSMICVHIYVMNNWTREVILLELARVQDGGCAKSMVEIICSALLKQGGLTREEICQKFISIGTDGASVFQGARAGVVRQLQDDHAPFVQGIHCLAHRVNLAMKVLSKLHIMSCVESMLTVMHAYFAHSPKRHVEFERLAAMMNKKGQKILLNVKTRWISMLKPAK
jgi:hypothetical protein